MLVIKTNRNYIDIEKIASNVGVNKEYISLRRAEGSSKLWRAWISPEIKNVEKAEKDLLWSIICDGCEAVILKENKGWRRALR